MRWENTGNQHKSWKRIEIKLRQIVLFLVSSSAFVCHDIAAELRGFVSAIDTASNTVSATASGGIGPSAIPITPNGSTAYVVSLKDSVMSVVGEKKKAKGYFEKFYYNEIGWTAVSGANSYTIYRDGEQIGETSLNYYQDDHGIKKSQSYTYEIYSLSNGVSSSVGTVVVQ